MTTIADLVEADNDWLSDVAPFSELLDEKQRALILANVAIDSPEFDELVRPFVLVERRMLERRMRDSGVERSFTDRVQDEMHKLLCSDQEYADERTQFREQFKVGQAGLAAAITTVLLPVLGTSSPIAGAAVALCLAAIGRVSLGAWWAQQADRRSRLERKEAKLKYAEIEKR